MSSAAATSPSLAAGGPATPASSPGSGLARAARGSTGSISGGYPGNSAGASRIRGWTFAKHPAPVRCKEVTPDPATYTPEHVKSSRIFRSPRCGFGGSSRFPTEKQASPGPAAYEPMNHLFGPTVGWSWPKIEVDAEGRVSRSPSPAARGPSPTPPRSAARQRQASPLASPNSSPKLSTRRLSAPPVPSLSATLPAGSLAVAASKVAAAAPEEAHPPQSPRLASGDTAAAGGRKSAASPPPQRPHRNSIARSVGGSVVITAAGAGPAARPTHERRSTSTGRGGLNEGPSSATKGRGAGSPVRPKRNSAVSPGRCRELSPSNDHPGPGAYESKRKAGPSYSMGNRFKAKVDLTPGPGDYTY